MPASHGDSSTPWYDLPAANMMHLIDSQRPGPIHPRDMKPLRFTPGPADPELVIAVQDFLKDVERSYQPRIPEEEGVAIDIDPMGQCIINDAVSGEQWRRESYYGWSIEFCEKMKRKEKGLSTSVDNERGRNRNRLDQIPGEFRKRHRNSLSGSRSWSRGQYSSSDVSRSRSRERFARRRRYSSSPRSASPLQGHRFSPGRYRSPSPYSPPTNFSTGPTTTPAGSTFVPPPFSFVPQQGSSPMVPPFPTPPFPIAGAPSFPPPPPPPPPPYSGPWPPQPPPPNLIFSPGQTPQVPGMPQFGFPPPPPPPPGPPPPPVLRQQHSGRPEISRDMKKQGGRGWNGLNSGYRR